MGNSNSKKKIDKKFILAVLGMIFLLSLATYWNFKNLRKSLRELELQEFKIPEFEIPEFELTPQKEEDYKEWVSPDGKLKMKYSANWVEMEKEMFEGFTQESKGENLFFAQKLELEKESQSFLMVQELNFEEEKDVEKIIEQIKEGVEEKEGEMEILKLEIEEKTAVFEANYIGETGLALHSKEKIILNEGKTYLITFSTLEKNWQDFQGEAGEIISSIQLLE